MNRSWIVYDNNTKLILEASSAPASVWDLWVPPSNLQVTRLEVPNGDLGLYSAPGTYYGGRQVLAPVGVVAGKVDVEGVGRAIGTLTAGAFSDGVATVDGES